jgi:hypothetical protein
MIGLGGQNHFPSIWLTTCPHRLLYLTPPLCHPNLALCPPLWWCTLCQDNNPRQQGSDNKNARRTEVSVSLKPTVITIFLLITDSKSYSIVLFFHYRFFRDFFNLTTLLFNTPSFSFSLVCFFFLFCFFSDSVIYFFVCMHLCIDFTFSFGHFKSSSIYNSAKQR